MQKVQERRYTGRDQLKAEFAPNILDLLNAQVKLLLEKSSEHDASRHGEPRRVKDILEDVPPFSNQA
jgi:hypothetical protein